jgi:hypothetical protein
MRLERSNGAMVGKRTRRADVGRVLNPSISKNGWETARVHRYKLDKEDNDDSESVSQNIKHSTRKSGVVKFQAVAAGD